MTSKYTSTSDFRQISREYDLESLPDLDTPRILDIGANEGQFSLYASQRWPSAVVLAYEPHPDAFEILVKNVSDLAVHAMRYAVTFPRSEPIVRLYEGKTGTHEASLRTDLMWTDGGGSNPSKWNDVPALSAITLPACDVLKIDTEGSEVEILQGYRFLDSVRILMVECHPVMGNMRNQQEIVIAMARKAGLVHLTRRAAVLRFTR